MSKEFQELDFGNQLKKEKALFHFKILNKFLNPPYTFEVPEDPKKLLPGDPNYDDYLCRNNVRMILLSAMNDLFSDPLIDLSEYEISAVETANKVIRDVDGTKNRTEEEMLAMKKVLESIIDILKRHVNN